MSYVTVLGFILLPEKRSQQRLSQIWWQILLISSSPSACRACRACRAGGAASGAKSGRGSNEVHQSKWKDICELHWVIYIYSNPMEIGDIT
jgi:hypothetical protein